MKVTLVGAFVRTNTGIGVNCSLIFLIFAAWESFTQNTKINFSDEALSVFAPSPFQFSQLSLLGLTVAQHSNAA